MIAKVVKLTPEHVHDIIDRNIAEGVKTSSVSVDEMIKAYLSPGSAAYCLEIDEKSVVCGGIINIGWSRGEAWLLTSSLFYKYRKTGFKIVKQMLPGLAEAFKFRRVQAVSMNGSDIFNHLGFEREGVLRAYGPDGENIVMLSRVF